MAAVGADGDRADAAQRPAGRAARHRARRDAARAARLLGERAGFPAAVEDGDRAAGERGGVDACPVGRDGEPLGRVEGAAERAAGGAQVDRQPAVPGFCARVAAGEAERPKEVTLSLNSEVT